MPQFEYVARRRNGERTSGSVQAADSRAAARALREDDLYPVRIEQRGASRWGASLRHYLLPLGPARHAQFFTQLASLLRTGVNAHDALDELSAIGGDRRLRRVAREISEQLAEGEPIAEQFARYPALFPGYVTGFIAAGERLGALPEMLQELAEQFETQARVGGRLKWLRLYYSAVLVLALLVAPLPWIISRGFGWYAELAATRLLPILAALIVLIFVLRALRAVPAFERFRSRVALAVPVFGAMARWSAVARFLRTLNLSQRAGVTFHQALEIAGDATGFAHLQGATRAVAIRVRTGMGVDEAVQRLGFLPQRVRQMIAGGERTGELERRLEAAADYAIERRDTAVNRISAGAAGASLAGSAVVVGVAVYFAYKAYVEALFERAGV